MANIIEEIATSLREWIIQPTLTTADCTPDKVSLEQTICGIYFRFPLMPSPMSCLYYGKECSLAMAASKEGMPPVIHYNQGIDDQLEIIGKIREARERSPKKGGIEFVDNPVRASSRETLGQLLHLVKKHGYSIIPILEEPQALSYEPPHGYFYGAFKKPFSEAGEPENKLVTELLPPLYYKKENLGLGHVKMTKEEVDLTLKELEKKTNQHFLPILDEQGRLVTMAFRQKFQGYQCGGAISTHTDPGDHWIDRAKACIEAGADFMVIDTSQGHSEFELAVAQEFKKRWPEVPLVCGNIVTARGFEYLKDYADMVRVGMMTGAACTTGKVRNVGRPLFSALKEIRAARDRFYESTGKYIHIIADGGINSEVERAVALALADIVMGGIYFAQFYESAGRGVHVYADKSYFFTNEENEITHKEYWGEGSHKAKNLIRYGQTPRTSLVEGIYGLVPYRGRLKPCVEEDMKKLSSTLASIGAHNLQEYREKAILERCSQQALKEREPNPEIIVIET